MAPSPDDDNIRGGMLQDINSYVDKCWHSYGNYDIYDATDSVEINGPYRKFVCKCDSIRVVRLGIQVANCEYCGLVMVDRKFDRSPNYERLTQSGLGDF